MAAGGGAPWTPEGASLQQREQRERPAHEGPQRPGLRAPQEVDWVARAARGGEGYRGDAQPASATNMRMPGDD
eukprot:7328122-Heterocapsa_arctica.AAC.1